MQTKPEVDVGSDRSAKCDPIQTLLDGLAADELERMAEAVILEHQCRLQKAQNLFEEISRLETAGEQDGLERIQYDYRLAMLNLHGQHHLVRQVVGKLGHVPVINGRKPILD
jgi:hypothetical protein